MSAHSGAVTVVRAVDAALDAVIILLASWTLVYHACLLAGWGATVAALVELAVVAAVAAVWSRRRWSDDLSRPALVGGWEPPGRTVCLALVVLAVAAATVFGATRGPWILVWSLWLVTAAVGVIVAVRGWRPGAVAALPDVPERGGWLAVAMAAGAAALARFILRPEDDDAHYVHLSTWIAQHGEFPVRDTLYSDQIYAALYWPPIDSWPALTGAVSHLTGISAPTVVYAIAAPVLAFLSVLAMWRLLRAWRVPYAVSALAIALMFLLWDAQQNSDFLFFDAGFGYRSFGNFFLVRIWQGKVAFLCLVVPLLYVYLQRNLERPTRATTVMLVAASIAGVGLSTSAMLVVPLLVTAAMIPVAVRSPRRAVSAMLAGAGYPAVAAIVTAAVGGHTPDLYTVEQVQPERLGRIVLGLGIFASIGLLAALLAWRIIREPVARVMLAGAALVAAIPYAPGVGDLIYDVTGLGRTQWRLVWIVPVAALVGAMAATVIARIETCTLRHTAVVGMAGALALVGTPVWATVNGARFSTEAWKLRPAITDVAERVAAVTAPEDTVLLPGPYGISLVIVDGSVTVVDLRFYTNEVEDQANGLAAQRIRLMEFVTYERAPSDWQDVAGNLRQLGVDVTCMPTRRSRSGANYSAAAARYLLHYGYSLSLRTDRLWCYRRG